MKRISTALLFLRLCSVSFSSHIVGGDITAKWLNGNTFEISLNYYRDCNGQALPLSVEIGIYELQTDAPVNLVTLYSVSSGILNIGDSCNDLSSTLCVEQGLYQGTVNIPDNTNGYYLSHVICCRNNIINNIRYSGYVGMVFYAEIPNPALHKSTPVFGQYPNPYFCIKDLNYLDYSCSDPDGDSLVYSLVDPLEETADPIYYSSGGSILTPAGFHPGPYIPIAWKTPTYNLGNIIGGSPVMSIDSATGLITSSPDSSSNGKVFVFSVRVEKYDKATKQKLGEARRDVLYTGVVCYKKIAPGFILPSELYVSAGDSVCFDITLTDANKDDSVFVSSTDLSENVFGFHEISFTPIKGIKETTGKCCISASCDNTREAPYPLTFKGRDTSCAGASVTFKTVNLYVSTLDGAIKYPVPNVFTPNGDTKNDFFNINATVNHCFDSFVINIYDRWGDKVFGSNDFLFSWNGYHYKTGLVLDEGIYFYSLEGHFKDHTVEKKGYVSLLK